MTKHITKGSPLPKPSGVSITENSHIINSIPLILEITYDNLRFVLEIS